MASEKTVFLSKVTQLTCKCSSWLRHGACCTQRCSVVGNGMLTVLKASAVGEARGLSVLASAAHINIIKRESLIFS